MLRSVPGTGCFSIIWPAFDFVRPADRKRERELRRLTRIQLGDGLTQRLRQLRARALTVRSNVGAPSRIPNTP